MDLDAVVALTIAVAASTVTPRFRALRSGDVDAKSAGEVVTVADREAEALLTAGLLRLTPDAVVVGEEATHADPTLPDALARGGRVWLVDPLDGTANFVAGSPDHAVMLALVEDGVTVAAVIHQPQHGHTWTSTLGGGAWRDGVRLTGSPCAAGDLATTRGDVLRRFLPAGLQAAVDGSGHPFGELGHGSQSAGVDYPRLVAGGPAFVLYWRTLPWDHAPGALLLREAGGSARRLDGSDWQPAVGGEGLLAVSHAGTHEAVLAALGLDAQ